MVIIRSLTVIVLLWATGYGQTNSYSDISGYTGNLLFYKNAISPENQITAVMSSGSMTARYGYWDFSTDIFEPFYPTFYPLASTDPETLAVFLDGSGVGTLVGVVHPFIPELLSDSLLNPSSVRPYLPPNSDQGVAIEFFFLQDSYAYSSIIVLNAIDGMWLASDDQAVIGQIQALGGGTAITMVPEPSSLSLLLAGGAVLMAGRRRVVISDRWFLLLRASVSPRSFTMRNCSRRRGGSRWREPIALK